MVGFAAETASHVGRIGEPGGLERLCGAERPVAFLAATDQAGIFGVMPADNINEVWIRSHPHWAHFQEGDVTRTRDVAGIELLHSADIQVGIALSRVKQLLGFLESIAALP